MWTQRTQQDSSSPCAPTHMSSRKELGPHCEEEVLAEESRRHYEQSEARHDDSEMTTADQQRCLLHDDNSGSK